MVIGGGLRGHSRRGHVLATEDELGQLKADFRVVKSGGYHGCSVTVWLAMINGKKKGKKGRQGMARSTQHTKHSQ